MFVRADELEDLQRLTRRVVGALGFRYPTLRTVSVATGAL
jgi:hypothetical protein